MNKLKKKKKKKNNLYWSNLSRLYTITCKCSLNCNYYSVISVVCLVRVVVSNVGELRSVQCLVKFSVKVVIKSLIVGVLVSLNNE